MVKVSLIANKNEAEGCYVESRYRLSRADSRYRSLGTVIGAEFETNKALMV